MPVDSNNTELKFLGIFYSMHVMVLTCVKPKKGLPKFYFRQPLGNPTYSSPNLATLAHPPTHSHPYTHPHTHPHIHRLTHTHTNTHSHTHPQTHTYTHTHTHTMQQTKTLR